MGRLARRATPELAGDAEMDKSLRPRTIKAASFALLVASLAALLTSSSARPARLDDSTDRQIRFAQLFLRAFYPDDPSQQNLITASKTGAFDADWPSTSPLNVEIDTRYAPGCPKPMWGDDPPRCPVLAASFAFGLDGMLDEAHMNPLDSTEKKLEQTIKLVEAHPEWSDAQISETLRRSGAKFAPGDHGAPTTPLPLDKLRPFIGPFSVTSTEFNFRHQQDPKPFANLYWEVHVTTKSPTGSPEPWRFLFEPFDGRPIDLHRDTSTR